MTNHSLPSTGMSLYFCVACLVLALSGCGSASDTGGEAGGTGATNESAGARAPGTNDAGTVALFANAVSSAEIDLAWSTSADDQATVSYRVLRNGTPVAELENATSYEDIGLRPSTSYAYTVEARDARGNLLGRSEPQSATTPATDTTPPEVVAASTEDGEPVPVNSSISVDFTAPMSESQLNADRFQVQTRGGAQVPGEVKVSGNSATFTPASQLAAETEHTATIAAGTTDAAGNALASTFATTFATAAAADTVAPRVTSTYPAANATGVATNSALAFTFSEPMLATTLTTANFRVWRSGTTTNVAGTLKIIGNTGVFTPTARLALNTAYAARVTTGVKDRAGNAMAANYTWTFNTGTATDATAPRVSSTVPAGNATGVALNSTVKVTFSEAMRSTTLTTASIRMVSSSGTAVSGTTWFSPTTLQFTPAQSLVAGTRYTVTVNRSALDMAGNALAATYSWSFTAAGTTDATPPRVTSVTPANLATGVATNTAVSATFSEAMRDSTITTSSVLLANAAGTRVTGTVSVSGNTVTFRPTAALSGSSLYTATITNAVRDAAGNALAANYSWSFTTAAATTTAGLAWDAVASTAVTGYRLYYGTASGRYSQAAGQGLNVGKVTAYTLTGLTRGTRYYFAVTAYSATGQESAYSNEAFKDIP